MKKWANSFIVAGLALEVIDYVSKGPLLSSDATIAGFQAELVNFNESLGSIHIGYILAGVGIWLHFS